MGSSKPLGGVIHTYQKFDPKNFPSPTQPPPDMVSTAFEHMLTFGSMRELSEEELAQAVHLDPSQIAGLGPSLEALREMLLARKRKILETYETKRVRLEAAQRYQEEGLQLRPPKALHKAFHRAFRDEQLRELEQLWYAAGGERGEFAHDLLRLAERLGDKYQIDEMAGKYEFTGHERLTVPQALAVKEELEKIDELLKQLEEAARTAQIGVIDMEQLSEFANAGEIEQLNALHQQIQEYLRDIAEQQGLEKTRRGFKLTPKAYRLFQGKLLERIFSDLAPSRTGRHQGPIVGEGAVELQHTKPYEFGDSVTQMDIPATLTNAMIRSGASLPIRLRSEDIEIHRTRNTPKCATVVLMDMSGSMRYGGLYVNVKRMGLALDGLIRREFPGDFLQFIEMYSFARPRHVSEIATLLPKMVTIFDPYVHYRVDMSKPDITEAQVPQHFTNIQHALHMSRKFLALQQTPNRQVILITDGLPTAHFEGQQLHLRYPPDQRTEQATMREAQLCQRDGITINIFLLSSWSQSREDVQFAYRLAESTKGRVFFTAGRDLDRYVVWDYVSRKRHIIS
ncbi:MAG TPA: hypothetical protein VGG64_28685 [Pirellulales bacterium]|jgi:uncharacterized protein with von Willebrand factor type A (vWA) domain